MLRAQCGSPNSEPFVDRRAFVRWNTVAFGGLALEACARAVATSSPLDTRQPLADAAGFARARRFATTPFGDIAYVAEGTGPAALFLHGYPLNGFQWRGAIERLRDVRH